MIGLYPAAAGLLFAIGLYGLIGRTALITRVLGANIMTSAVFLYLLAVATKGEGPPDPVPQAMVLTGIVITISLTAFALVLLRVFHTLAQRDALEDAPEETAEDGD